ncbi:hypothetical protein BaRGS_00026095, partial [Batillaria attramentaria]
MLRFNYFKHYFAPPAGMDNPALVPNPLTSPALMMLASTAEGRDAPRLPAPPHPYSSQSMDKDMPAPPPHFSNAGFVYREPFPGIYPPMPPFIRPNLERSMGLIHGAGGAFRQLGPHEGVEPYHSAFTPAKKTKIDEVSCTSTYSSSDGHESGYRDKDGENSRKSMSPSVKEERPSSISSAGGDTNSEIHSDAGDLYDRGTPDSEGRSLRKQRKRSALDGHTPCCPICGLTLRPGEMDAHLAIEVDKLERICRALVRPFLIRLTPVFLSTPAALYEKTNSIRASCQHCDWTLPSPSGRKGKDSPSPEAVSRSRFERHFVIARAVYARAPDLATITQGAHATRGDIPDFLFCEAGDWQTYLRIRCNRQSRLNARSRNKKRRIGEENAKETQCPICSERLAGTPEELNAHVELCLKKQRQQEGEEEPVDVEGIGDQYEEYTWAGQTRIRATTLLEGGFAASGFQTAGTKKSPEHDGDLNVDGDDSEEYGKPQYPFTAEFFRAASREKILILIRSDSGLLCQEEVLLGVLKCCSGTETAQAGSSSGSGETTQGSSGLGEAPDGLCSSESETSGNQVALVSALKARLRELEQARSAKQKCLICM